MDKTKIGWCDSTWNPVTGCLHGCEYCYARGIAHRFGDKRAECHVIRNQYERLEKNPYPYGFDPTFHRYLLNDYVGKQGRNIFVCSMADLFGEWVPDSWIEEVFKSCKKAPQHKYIFLTKNPRRYIELCQKGLLPQEDNFWFGSSATRPSNHYSWFTEQKFHWFLSLEPLLEEFGEINQNAPKPEWVIIGAETGNRKDKVVPDRSWIENIVEECRKYGIPIFMKSSLEDIWKEPLIQEFPEGLKRKE